MTLARALVIMFFVGLTVGGRVGAYIVIVIGEGRQKGQNDA